MGDDGDAVVREQAVATNMVRMNVRIDEKFNGFVCGAATLRATAAPQVGSGNPPTAHRHRPPLLPHYHCLQAQHVQLALNLVQRKCPLLRKDNWQVNAAHSRGTLIKFQLVFSTISPFFNQRLMHDTSRGQSIGLARAQLKQTAPVLLTGSVRQQQGLYHRRRSVPSKGPLG